MNGRKISFNYREFMGDREDEEGVAFEALKDPLYRLLVTEARQNVMK